MKLKSMYKLVLAASVASSFLGFANLAHASAFQLWEQDAASIGDYHAGGAAEADSASTEWYNPAGMTRIKHQQLSLGGTVINVNAPFNGTVEVDTINPGQPKSVSDQGGGFNFVPNLHYVAPINNRFAVGVGVVVPFGLKTDWGSNTFLRYAGTLTKVQVIDITPAVAFQLNRVLSFGVGMDIARTDGEFDQAAGLGQGNDTTSTNKGHDWTTGAHFGVLAQLTKSTRFGMAYHTQLVNHMHGTSTFSGPLANNFAGGVETNDNLQSTFALPAWAEFSLYQQIDKKWAVMGSVNYTQWSGFNKLILKNVAALSSNKVRVVIPENYRNTWNFALGAHYQATQKWLLKTGLGWEESPTRPETRNIQLPDQNRFIVALGAQYQLLKNLAIAGGYQHLFVKKSAINVSQTVDIQNTTTVGNVKGDANVFGLQLIWNIT